MTNNTLKYRDFLLIFNQIQTKGIKLSSAYEFLGINAQHDFDGYTCWLAYKDLTVTLLFHGKFYLQFEHRDTVREFYKKAHSLLALN